MITRFPLVYAHTIIRGGRSGAEHRARTGKLGQYITVTTAEDIGVLTAAILFAETTSTNQIVYAAGDTVTYGQVADAVDAVLNRKIERVEWTLAELKADLARQPEDAIRKYRVVFGGGKGVAWEKAKTFNVQQKIETVDVAQWIHRI